VIRPPQSAQRLEKPARRPSLPIRLGRAAPRLLRFYSSRPISTSYLFCFDTLPNSCAAPQNISPAVSITSRLFSQNTRRWRVTLTANPQKVSLSAEPTTSDLALPLPSPLPTSVAVNMQLTEKPSTLSPAFATLTRFVCPNSFVCHSYAKSPGVGILLPLSTFDFQLISLACSHEN
jgi:hypothetical protein